MERNSEKRLRTHTAARRGGGGEAPCRRADRAEHAHLTTVDSGCTSSDTGGSAAPTPGMSAAVSDHGAPRPQPSRFLNRGETIVPYSGCPGLILTAGYGLDGI